MEYYIIPENIATEFQGFQKNNIALHFTKTNQGWWVINTNCQEKIFTEITWSEFQTIDLSKEDFVPNYENKPLVNGYRVVNVLDNYDNTILITLFKEELFEIVRTYEETWTDETVFEYVNQLD